MQMAGRRMTAEDIFRFELAAEPVLSPNGQWAVYQRTVADADENGYRTHLYIAPMDGHAPPRALTTVGTKNTGAAWSPDGGTLAFVSNRSHGSQAWLLSLDGGDAVRVTRFRYGISSLRWSPDGRTLFGLVPTPYGGDVEVFEPDLSEKEARTRFEQEDKDWRESPKRYRLLYYKMNGVGLRNHRSPQLVAVDVKTGEYRQLTWGEMGVSAPAPSPDGAMVAVISNRHPLREIEQQEHQHVYLVPAGGGALRLLTDRISARDVAWSPDGSKLAVFGVGEELSRFPGAAQTKLFIVSRSGQDVLDLTAEFPDALANATGSDVRAEGGGPGPVWAPDGRALFAISGREGRAEVIRFPLTEDGRLASEPLAVIGGDRNIFAFATRDGQRFVVLYGTPTDPSRVVSVDIGADPHGQARPCRAVTDPMEEAPIPPFPAQETRLDRDNRWLAEVDLVEPEPFWYTSADGWRAQGWVLPPLDRAAGAKYPVILEIHGGPQTNYGFMMFHEMQWFAARGYAVVYTNPRGSTSYGQEFVHAVCGHYGENDMADILKGLDAAIERFDFLDADQVAVTGGSYGGYMTNWIVGHTGRFFAAVSQRSISNWISFYGTADIGPGFVEHQLGVATINTAADRDRLWEKSPLAYAASVTTPLLLIHSEEDLRCPMEQAEQFYTAIKRRGGEVELFRVPQANHDLSRNGKPKLRVARLNAILDWFDAHRPTRAEA
jgi:acylaminoacyl-peptidase